MVLENHSETFSLSGNIDPRYFQEAEDGKYKATTTLLYNASRDALSYYKNLICKLDKDNTYSQEKVKTVKDTWTTKLNEEERKRQYGPQLAELNKRKKEWREAHPEMCSVVSGGIDLGDENEMKYFAGYKPETTPTLEQALGAYKWLLDNYEEKGGDGETLSNKLKAMVPQKSNYTKVTDPEGVKEYKAMQEKWIEELGIPMIVEPDKITVTRTDIKKKNSKVMKAITPDSSPIEDYVNGLITYLTTVDKESYLKDRDDRLSKAYEELTSTIQTNLADAINNTKGLTAKTDMGGDNLLTAFAKTSEDDEDKPVVFKVDEVTRKDGSYKNCQLVVDLSDGDDEVHSIVPVKNTEGVKLALQSLLMILDGTSFDNYKADIEAIIDGLK